MTRTLIANLSLLAVLLSCPVSADTIILDFNGSGIGDIRDLAGRPTGFTHRMPGSGAAIPANDPNLNVDTANGHLLMTSTRSDFNITGFGRNLAALDAPSLKLNGMAGVNFSVQARFLDIHVDQPSDQLGVFVGTSVDKLTRGGVFEWGVESGIADGTYTAGINYSENGHDGPPTGGALHTILTGQDAEFEIRRVNNVWQFLWRNLSDPSLSGSVDNLLLPSLNAEDSLYLGVFHLDARNTTPQVATLDQFVIRTGTSIPEPATIAIAGLLFAAVPLRRFAHAVSAV